MGEILLITLCSFVLAAPISFAASLFYVFSALFLLHLFDLSEVRGGVCAFVALNMAVFAALSTFLVLFAHFCRSF